MQMDAITLDMDGTIANLYGYEGWLGHLGSGSVEPYAKCEPLGNAAEVDALLRELQALGTLVEVVSWASKGGTQEYADRIRDAKLEWLARHLPSVRPSNVHVVPYGTPKSEVGAMGLLLDDERRNCEEWRKAGGVAYEVTEGVTEVLKAVLKAKGHVRA